jgi:DUF4097 and DUF4098 domain-containing protein YvlB
MRVGALKVGSRSGSISVKGVKESLVVRSYNGNVTIETVGGKVDVESANGNISIRDTEGDLRANSAVGSLDIQCIKGRAEINTATGSITIYSVGGDVEATNARGSVSFKGTIRSDGRYKLKSLSGPVEMSIQSDAPGFSAALISYSGEIETAFPIKTEAPIPRDPINRHVKGTYKGGGAQIMLDSFNGGVKLLKAAPNTLKNCK